MTKRIMMSSFGVIKSGISGNISMIAAIATAVVIAAIPVSAIAESDDPAPPAQEQQTATAPPSPEPAEPVYEARARANGKSHIRVTWPKVEGADGYTVYRSSKPDRTGRKIYTTKSAFKRSYKDKKAAVHKKYWYTVKAWEKTGGRKKTLAVIEANGVKNVLKYKSSDEFKTYAYSGGGTTASGKKAKVGRVAVDPNIIKLGTWLYIEGYGLCQAADTGGAIKGQTIDLYMDSESECYDWGIRHKDVYILE
jgi:3D (Asp-Asp-Asp) domain-containing protein